MTTEDLDTIRGAIARSDLIDEESLPLAFSDRKRLLAEVDRLRAENARPVAQERASGPNTPAPYTGEGTAPTSPHGAAQAAIDTIARILVGTDWDEKVRYTDIGSRETVEQIAGRISTAMAIAYYQQAARSLRALGHGTAADLLESTARDLEEGDTTE